MPGGELSRGLHAQAAMGTHPVVFPPPVADDHPALREGVEQFPGEALAPELVVETLHVAVLPRTTRFDGKRPTEPLCSDLAFWP